MTNGDVAREHQLRLKHHNPNMHLTAHPGATTQIKIKDIYYLFNFTDVQRLPDKPTIENLSALCSTAYNKRGNLITYE